MADDSRPRSDAPLVYALIALGGAVYLWALAHLSPLPLDGWMMLITAAVVMTLAAKRGLFSLPFGRAFLTLGDPIVLAALVFGGPAPAVVLAGWDGIVSNTPKQHRIRSRAVSLGILSLAVFSAAQLFEALAPADFRDARPANALVPAMFAATLAYFGVNSMLVALLAARRRQAAFWSLWWHEYAWAIPPTIFSGGAALLAFAASKWYGPIALLIGVPAAFVTYFFYWSWLERSKQQHRHIDDLRRVNGQIMEALALAIESRDPQARGHARRVQVYAEEIGRRVRAQQSTFDQAGDRLDDGWFESLSTAALMHDVGKLALPDHLLYKSGPLLRGERDKVRQHSVLGEAMVGRLAFPRPLGPIIRHHHEQWDGGGYPDGLQGEAIPLAARVLCLADSLDGVRRTASDGTVPSVETLIHHVARHAGTRLDPRLAELYCSAAEEIETAVRTRSAAIVARTEHRPSDESLLADIGNARKEAVVMYDMARHIATSLDLTDTLANAVGSLAEVIPSNSLALYLTDDLTGQVVPRYTAGPLGSVLQSRSFARGEGITGWVFETGEAVVGADPRVDLGAAAEDDTARARSVAVFPLADEDGVLGVIAFYNEEPQLFDGNHRRIMETVAPQVARALRNALLYEATRNTSMTDALTGLPNSRFLYTQIDKEMARSTRRGLPLCVVVMDLDGFKPVNDTHGHRSGDMVLRAVAQLLREGFRSGDTVVRYAGDEFVALLPETSAEETTAILQRVQADIATTEIPVEAGQSVRVGISAGFACFPLDGSTLEDLIHRADKEMYRDKAERKAPSAVPTR